MWVKQYKDSKEAINLDVIITILCLGGLIIGFRSADEDDLTWCYETEKQRDQAFLYLCGIANVEIIGDK